MVLVVRHFPGLRESQIEIEVSWITESVSRADFTGICVTKALINLVCAAGAKEFWRSVRGFIRTCAYVADRGGIGLYIPVRRPLLLIKWRNARGQATVESDDTRKLPATQNSVSCLTRVAEESVTFAKWKHPDYTGVDVVANIEIRAAIIFTLAERIRNERPVSLEIAESVFRLQSGRVIQRMGIRIVEV